MKPAGFILFDKSANPFAVVYFTVGAGWIMAMIQSSLTGKLFGGNHWHLIRPPRAKRERPQDAVKIAIDVLEQHHFNVDRRV